MRGNFDVIAFDVETTGLSAKTERVTEIGAVRICDLQIVDTFSTFVNPEKPIPKHIVKLTGITDDMVYQAPKEEEAIRKFFDFCGTNPVLAAHNASFDASFVRAICDRHNIYDPFTTFDTLALSRKMIPNLSSYKLDDVARALELEPWHHHRAFDDAETLGKIYIKLAASAIVNFGAKTLDDLNTKSIRR